VHSLTIKGETSLSKQYRICRDQSTGESYLETALTGAALLANPILNKGSGFSEEERRDFGLDGLLPATVSSLELQLERIYGNYQRQSTNIGRYMNLLSLQDRNETAYYALLNKHLTEMMPIIYTPVVGEACQTYSRIYHRPRGVYVSYPQRDHIDALLANFEETDIQVIVVTDGERILGLGDLGVGGMGIPIGKLALYTACAGIHPSATLPIVLDVGTNNPELLNDPLYLGWRNERIRGQQYDEFIEAFIAAVMRRFPHALLQWEDFAKNNASRLLDRYRDRLCSFNDDIQGTGAVTLSAAMAAVTVTGSSMKDQSVVVYGAGSAASGIVTQLITAMGSEGASEQAARAAIYLVDSQGLVHSKRSDLESFKQEYAQPFERVAEWSKDGKGAISLLETIKRAKPTILIGTAAQPKAFDEAIVREMAKHVARPIIFPLSNPTSKCEAFPEDIINWTEGRALVATGSPFADVNYGGKTFRIAQCNNAYIFPGVGLGVVATKAPRVTDSMFVAAARALSELSPVHQDATAPLLPSINQVRAVSQHVAVAVGREAQRSGLVAPMSDHELAERIDATMWHPKYLPYRRVR
jgi:malate dehydrogenase (oxaloacetate-decarboxylating)